MCHAGKLLNASAAPEECRINSGQESLRKRLYSRIKLNSELLWSSGGARKVWAFEKARYVWAKEQAKRVWASQRAMTMTQKSISQWLGPLCLPMVLIIQPLTEYNMRACLVLMVLAFLLWTQYKHRTDLLRFPLRFGYQSKKHQTIERFCEKCERYLHDQMRLSATPHPDLMPASWFSLDSRSLRRVPWRLMSRYWGQIAHTEQLPAFLTAILIWFYMKLFGCNLHEAEKSEIASYTSLGDFFTRKLKLNARLVCSRSTLVSPADGTVTFHGKFTGGFLQQVKGVHYSLNYFLGLHDKHSTNGFSSTLHGATFDIAKLLVNPSGTALFQWVIYLSPGDYHRFHSPAEWMVETRRHFPGELLSVKPNVVSSLPGLFHLNERVAWLGRWRHGFFSMTAVGATNVGSIHSVFEPDLRTNQAISLKRECVRANVCSKRNNFLFSERVFQEPIRIEKGSEFGHFSFGSTLVLVFEAPENFAFSLGDEKVRVGQGLEMLS